MGFLEGIRRSYELAEGTGLGSRGDYLRCGRKISSKPEATKRSMRETVEVKGGCLGGKVSQGGGCNETPMGSRPEYTSCSTARWHFSKGRRGGLRAFRSG